MEQFNLDTWLQDKSRKVTTRLGNREVRIICWDRKDNSNRPIITLMIGLDGNEYTTFHTKNGFVDENEKYIDRRDLFFADEEELTEFENKLVEIIKGYCPINENGEYTQSCLKDDSKELLDLARKELLKDLPKWKKANVFVSNEFGLATRDGDLIITHNGYQIKLSDLETLPKEE